LAVNPQVQPPLQAKRFAQKAARSIAELQDHVNNVADVVVFLEVLGYTESLVRQNGFESVQKLARYISEFIDIFGAEESPDYGTESLSPAIPSKFRRATENPGLLFPTLGFLAMILAVGVSPWLSLFMPLAVVTPLAGGALMGLVLSEGCLHASGRLFSFYLRQDNLGEAKRVLRRCYCFSFTVVGLGGLVVFFAALTLGVPYLLIAVLLGSYLTVPVHRIGYMMIYLMRPFGRIILSYATALVAAPSVYLLASNFVPDVPTRVVAGLGAAFAVLIIPAVHDNLSFFRTRTASSAPKEVLHFFAPASTGDDTLASRSRVQFWETLPNFIFGTFSLSVLLLDRVISWAFSASANGNQAILVNRLYDAGADAALILLVPALAVAYVMIAPMQSEVRNTMLELSASEMEKLNRVVRVRYEKVLVATILTSVLGMLVLEVLSGRIVVYFRGSEASTWIFNVAAIANVFMAVFVANSLFLSALKRVKVLAFVSVLCTLIVGAGGYFLAQTGFQNIVLAYLMSSITATLISSLYIRGIVTRLGSVFLARYL
jgi:hypothetical protein